MGGVEIVHNNEANASAQLYDCTLKSPTDLMTIPAVRETDNYLTRELNRHSKEPSFVLKNT